MDAWGLEGLLGETPLYEPPALRAATPPPVCSADPDPFFSDLEEDSEDVFLPAESPYSAAPPGATPHHSTANPWPPQLPVAIAMGLEELPEILARFGLTPERFEALKPLPAFRRALSEAQADLRSQGFSFKSKCRVIAEEFLDELYLKMYDPTVGISTKVDVFKYLTRMGELEPKQEAQSAAPTGPQVVIQFNLNEPQNVRVIS